MIDVENRISVLVMFVYGDGNNRLRPGLSLINSYQPLALKKYVGSRSPFLVASDLCVGCINWFSSPTGNFVLLFVGSTSGCPNFEK